MNSEATVIAKSQNPPNVLLGSFELIRRLSEEEAILEGKIINNPETGKKKKYYTDPIETLSSLVMKYGNKDIYKDVYKFIQM